MASRKASLYKYAPIDGQWKYAKAVFHPNNLIKPHAVLIGGVETIVKTGQYVLAVGGQWLPVGNDPKEAVVALRRKQGELLAVANGSTKVVSESSSASGTLRTAVNAYVQELKDAGRDKETVRAHRKCCEEFLESCNLKMLSGVTRQHCLRFINEYLQSIGNGNRTRFNKYSRLRALLRHAGLPDTLLTEADKVKYTVAKPVGLEPDDLEQLWKVCPANKKLLFTIFYVCGLRKGEVMTLRWVDIDFDKGLIMIRERPEYAWKPKANHIRNVPVSDGVLAELREQKAVSKYPLVFHTKKGKPLTHIWEDVQNVFAKTTVDPKKRHPHPKTQPCLSRIAP